MTACTFRTNIFFQYQKSCQTTVNSLAALAFINPPLFFRTHFSFSWNAIPKTPPSQQSFLFFAALILVDNRKPDLSYPTPDLSVIDALLQCMMAITSESQASLSGKTVEKRGRVCGRTVRMELGLPGGHWGGVTYAHPSLGGIWPSWALTVLKSSRISARSSIIILSRQLLTTYSFCL